MRKGSFPLLVVAVVLSVLGSAAFWSNLQSRRNTARFEEERTLLPPLLDAVNMEVQRRAKAEFGPDVLDGAGNGGSLGPDGDRWEWRFGLRRPGAQLLETTVGVELNGRVFKRYSGILVQTSGRPYDAVFVRLLSDALAQKGLRIESTNP